tara:strand:- start:1137 stop:6974 length:5838 start_codon:yes stop_codon:yes gene_type:complete
MAFLNANFEKSIQSVDTSITMFVTLGQHDSNGYPLPQYSYAFGTLEKSIKNINYNENLNIYPYLLGNLNVGQSLDLANRRHIISNVSVKIANQNIHSIGNQSGSYEKTSDVLISKFPSQQGTQFNSAINSHTVIWLVTSSSESLYDCVPIFRGVVRDVSYNKDSVSLKLEDHVAHIMNRDIPIGKMPDQNRGELSNGFSYYIEDDMKNKVVPLTLGTVRHAEPIFYSDDDSAIEVDDEIGSVGFESTYMVNDRVGRFFPNSNIYLLDHSLNDPVTQLDYMSQGGTSEDNMDAMCPEFEYKSTSLTVFRNETWQEVIDVKNFFVNAGIEITDYSFDTLETQEIKLTSKWNIDDDLGVPIPASTIANDAIYFFQNAEWEEGQWLVAGRNTTWQSFGDLLEIYPDDLLNNVANILHWTTDYQDGTGEGSFLASNEWDEQWGTFNPNKGLFSGYESIIESPALMVAKKEDCLESNFGFSVYSTQIFESFIGATLSQDHLDSIEFDEWVVMFYYDVGFRTATQELQEPALAMFQDSNGFYIGGSRSVAAQIQWQTQFQYTDDTVTIDNIFEDGEMQNGQDWVNDDNSYWLAANYWNNSAAEMVDEFHQDTATDYVRVKNRIVVGDKDGWTLGIPKGMGFRINGINFMAWSGETGYPISSNWQGGVQCKIYDFLIAYMIGQSGIIRDLRILSNGRGSGMTNGNDPLVNPDHSIVVSLEGSNQAINNPVSMIVHILEKELGINFNQDLSQNVIDTFNSHSEAGNLGDYLGHDSNAWVLNTHLTTRTKTQQVFESIAKNSLCLPIITTAIDGSFDLRFWFLKERFENITTPEVPVFGCTLDSDDIINFNPYATVNDGSCISDDGGQIIPGCTDDQIGEWPDVNGYCRGGALPFDAEGDTDLLYAHNKCLENPQPSGLNDGIYGYFSRNFNPAATIDDQTCDYVYQGGCNEPDAINYDPNAEWNDGTCESEPYIPIGSIYGHFDIVTRYHTLTSDDIGENNFPTSEIYQNPSGEYKKDAIDYIIKDQVGMFQRSFDVFAKHMLEWAYHIIYNFNSFGASLDGISSQDAMLCLIGYKLEIFTKAGGQPEGNIYHSVLRNYYYLPKANDYYSNPDALLTQDVFTTYPWTGYTQVGNSWEDNMCPGWDGNGVNSTAAWKTFVNHLVEINPSDIVELDIPNYSLPYTDIRTIEEPMNSSYTGDPDVNMEIYRAWTYLNQESNGDWEHAKLHIQAVDPSALTGLYWLAINGGGLAYSTDNISSEYEQLGLSNSNIEDYNKVDELVLMNLSYCSTRDYGTFDDMSLNYICPWLITSANTYWEQNGSCLYNGLEDMSEWCNLADTQDGLILEEISIDEPMAVADYPGVIEDIKKEVFVCRGGKASAAIINEVAVEDNYNIAEHLFKVAYTEKKGITATSFQSSSNEYERYYNTPDITEVLDIGVDLICVDSGGGSIYNIYMEEQYMIDAPFGSIEAEEARYGAGFNRANNTENLRTTATTRDNDTDIDRLIKSNEIIDYKIYQSKISDVCSRVKVLFDRDPSSGTYYKETEWEYWNEPQGILQNWIEINGTDPTGEELLDYYTADKTGYDEDGVPSIYAATSKVIQLDNTDHLPTAEKVRRAYLGQNMNQHTKMDLTLPLKYTNIELGDYVGLDYLIRNENAYGENYSLDYYMQTKNQDNPQGVHITRNGQVIYPLFIVEKIKYSLKNVKITISQVHDWTGEVTTDSEDSPDVGISTLTIENSFGGDFNNSIFVSKYGADGTLYLNQSTTENMVGVVNKTIFRFKNTASSNVDQNWYFEIQKMHPQESVLTTITISNSMSNAPIILRDYHGDTYSVDFLNSDRQQYYHIFDEVGQYRVRSKNLFGDTSDWFTINIYDHFDAGYDYQTNVQDCVNIIAHALGSDLMGTYLVDFYNENQMFGGPEAPYNEYGTQYELEASDGNFDGNIDILDIVALVGKILDN